MPKVTTLKTEQKGATFEAILKVDRDGIFKTTRPGTLEDWPRLGLTISGSTAKDVETAWREAVRDYVERTKIEQKVIIVRFDSTLRDGGKKSFFTNKETMLFLECAIALKVITTQGNSTQTAYLEHPDFEGLHAPLQPFPSRMLMRHQSMNWDRDTLTIVEWTQALEDTLVRACQGILAVVEMLDKATATPEALMLASTQQALLGSPIKNDNLSL